MALVLAGFLGSLNGGVLMAENIRLKATGIEAVVVDNEAWEEHSARYNGLAFLSAGPSYENIFKPLYGGFDLEVYFDRERTQPPNTPQDRNMLFEPRNIPMQLRRISSDTVELHEKPGPHWGIETWTRFQVRAPHSIDVQFHCIPRARLAPGKFLGLFFANYVNSPEDGAYYFLGRKNPGAKVGWIRAYSTGHNDKATFISDRSPVKTPFVPGYGDWLWSTYSESRFVYPFFYGVVKGQMYLLMFDRQDDIRFSHSPIGGGGTPAWDFQFIIPDYQVGRKYGFRARIVVEKFTSQERARADAIQEYERWSKRKVVLSSGK
jgi:hypothetical protein